MLLISCLRFTLFVLSAIFVELSYSQEFGQGVGQSCRLNSGGTGTCTSFDDCDLSLLYNEGNNPAVCGWSGGDAVVCCPRSTTSFAAPQQPQRPPQNSAHLSQSSQKCAEYKRIKCAQDNATSTIIGGQVVESVEEFPHQALIGYGDYNNPSWQCGGTLISEQWVLTAAHCLTTRAGGQAVAVEIGFLNRNRRNEFGTLQRFRVIQPVKHPERKNPHKYADIALLKLDRPAILSKAVLPACLHETFDIPVTRAVATGWGDTYSGSNAGTDDLMKVTLTLLDHNKCTDLFRPYRHLKQGIIREQQFCAGEAKKDTCQGDSGGPLQIIRDDYCMHSIIGVTSFGDNCGIKPGVYTRVSHYVPWIESVIYG